MGIGGGGGGGGRSKIEVMMNSKFTLVPQKILSNFDPMSRKYS